MSNVLQRVMEEEGDTTLFPFDVVDAYSQGNINGARKLLKVAIKEEANPQRKERMKHWYDDLRIWMTAVEDKPPTMSTINGIGTKLYGKYQPGNDGLHIATLWFTILFIPFIPISAWLVQPGEGSMWHFYGRVPIPPSAKKVLAVVSTLFIIPAMVGGGITAAVGIQSALRSASTAELVVVNGYDREVEVLAGGIPVILGAFEHQVLDMLEPGSQTLSAQFVDENEPFEEITVELKGGRKFHQFYNVGGRMLLERYPIVYGGGNVPDGDFLPTGSMITVARSDYLFEEPPEEKMLAEGSSDTDWAIDTALGFLPPSLSAMILASADKPEHIIAFGLAQLHDLEPDAGTAWLAANQLAASDPDKAQEVLIQACAQHPDSIDLHRARQSVVSVEQWDEMVAHYQEAYEDQPNSAYNAYLLARLLPTSDGAEIKRLLRSALSINPDLEPALLASAIYEIDLGSQRSAEAALRRYGERGEQQHNDVKEDLLRLMVARNATPNEVQSILSFGDEERFADLELFQLNAVHHPENLIEILANVVAAYDTNASDLPPSNPDFLLSEQVQVAWAAGDIERVTTLLAHVQGSAKLDVSATMSLVGPLIRIALSVPTDHPVRALVIDLIERRPHLIYDHRDLLLAWLLSSELSEQAQTRINNMLSVGLFRFVMKILDESNPTTSSIESALADLTPANRVVAQYVVSQVTADDRLARTLYQEAKARALPWELPQPRR